MPNSEQTLSSHSKALFNIFEKFDCQFNKINTTCVKNIASFCKEDSWKFLDERSESYYNMAFHEIAKTCLKIFKTDRFGFHANSNSPENDICFSYASNTSNALAREEKIKLQEYLKSYSVYKSSLKAHVQKINQFDGLVPLIDLGTSCCRVKQCEEAMKAELSVISSEQMPPQLENNL